MAECEVDKLLFCSDNDRLALVRDGVNLRLIEFGKKADTSKLLKTGHAASFAAMDDAGEQILFMSDAKGDIFHWSVKTGETTKLESTGGFFRTYGKLSPDGKCGLLGFDDCILAKSSRVQKLSMTRQGIGAPPASHSLQIRNLRSLAPGWATCSRWRYHQRPGKIRRSEKRYEPAERPAKTDPLPSIWVRFPWDEMGRFGTFLRSCFDR